MQVTGRHWLLIGLMTLALALRIWGVADRLPDPTLGLNPIIGDTSVDEGDRRAMLYAWEMWEGGTRPLDLNPRTGDWPGLPFYVTLGLQFLYRTYDSVAHGSTTAQEFARHVASDPSPMFLFARLFNVLIGVLTIFLTYLLGSRLGGRQVGLMAAAFLTLNPFHILISQRVADPNLLALVFVLLASLQLVGGREEHRVRASPIAGAMIGLAGACKYVPLALTVLLALACVDRTKGAVRVRWGPLATGLLASLLAFALASPFTILDWSAKARDLHLQQGRLLGEWVGLSESSVSLPTYLVRTLPHMLGWPVYLLSVAGSLLLLARPRSRGWIVALTPAVLLLPTGLLALAQERFMAPVVGSLMVAAAFAVVQAASWLTRRFQTSSAAASRAVTAATLMLPLAVSFAWAAPEYLRTRQALRRPDTRHLAHLWIETSIPRSEPIALDLYGPEFNAEEEGRLSLVWPFLATQAEYVRGAYHAEWLDGLHDYVTSEEIGGRFEASADRYPAEAAFHRWIRSHGRLTWSTDSVIASGPKIEVWALPERISDPERRGRLWDEVRRQPMYELRIAHWCRDMAMVFLREDQYPRAVEWAERGLTVRDRSFRRDLFETLSLAQVRLGRSSEAVTAAREGLTAFPESPLLHLDCGMALEALSRKEEAITEYRAALRQSPTPGAAQLIRALLARLEGGRPAP
ncbi:MAG TPA: glycosyltransferase family 39 protein [Candidatus Binatia bacterium]|nr:glycosyltransferase family 39 protein [Candidatus Binatia bacterium]